MSNTGRRIVLLLIVLVIAIALAPAALAVAAQDIPAIEVPEPSPADDTPSWTYRFLIPTLLVGTVIIIVLTVVLYFVKVVGKRYRVVQ